MAVIYLLWSETYHLPPPTPTFLFFLQVAFPVVAHAAGTLGSHRLDVYPNCQVSLSQVVPNTPYASLDGVSFSIKASDSSDWRPLLDTLPENPNNLAWGAPGSGWEQPQFSLEGDRVYLRGLISGSLQNGTLLGIVPATMRPHFAHSFGTIAHTGSST